MASEKLNEGADVTSPTTAEQEPSCLCQEKGHLWGGIYSFGGMSWHRDCYRCFESEDVSRSVMPQDEQPVRRMMRLLSA